MNGHDHPHALPAAGRRGRLAVVFGITATIMVAEIIGALASGSLALLADAGHMFTDSAGLLIALLLALPKALIVTVAGLGLLGSFTGALGQAMGSARERFAAAVAFAVAASSLSLFGVGSAFWSLVAGLLVLTLDAVAGRLRSRS